MTLKRSSSRMLIVIRSVAASGSSNRRQHAPNPSSYDISTLLLQPKLSIMLIMSNRRRAQRAANDGLYAMSI
jgi:hypothetical protein